MLEHFESYVLRLVILRMRSVRKASVPDEGPIDWGWKRRMMLVEVARNAWGIR